MLWPWPSKAVLHAAEQLAEATDVSPVKRWIYGICIALAFGAFGVGCIVQRNLIVDGLPLTAQATVAAGVLCLAIGAFLHAHFFWSADPRFCRLAQAGKVVSALVVLAALLFLAWATIAPALKGLL